MVPLVRERRAARGQSPALARAVEVSVGLQRINFFPRAADGGGRWPGHAGAESFPLVLDLEVVPVESDVLGTQMRWQRPTGEVIVTFPWWDHLETASPWLDGFKDGRAGTRDRAPVGTLDEPFFDTDQGWWFSAWEDDGFVFVETGPDHGTTVSAHFRMSSTAFFAAWNAGLTRIRGR